MPSKLYIRNLSPYVPGLPINQTAKIYGLPVEQIIKSASNESPLGPSPKALRAANRALKHAHRYPEQHDLVQALANHYKLQPQNIVLGNGSNDVLDLIARTFLGLGDQAISAQYAFAIYQIATQSTGAKNLIVPAINYGHDLVAMLKAINQNTKLIWIANPNNPTGTFIPYKQITDFLNNVPRRVIVVLDEAYFEYLSPKDQVDSTKFIANYPNVIIVRTFSKIYGLAGLRIGYGLASPKNIELLNRVRQPFNVSSIAVAAGTAALKDKNFVVKSKMLNKKGKMQICKALDGLNIIYIKSYGNFVAFKAKNATALNEFLLKQGIIVRPLANYGMANWLRVSVGTHAENAKFLNALIRMY